MSKELILSVHQLVDFLLRQGDIDDRVFNRSSMEAGTAIHKYYQNKQGNDYLSEYVLRERFNVADYSIVLEGRADGIITGGENVYIDEIKSTVMDLKEFKKSQESWHLGQAKCYALMYAHEKKLDRIGVVLTYIHQITDEKKTYKYMFDITELEQFVLSLLDDYLNFYNIIYTKSLLRNESAKELKFPFNSFRKGQRELAKYSYAIARSGGRLFVEAPTGIGKTISTIYPFVKSFADTDNEKIFYLTAKTSGQDAAYNAVSILKKKGLKVTDEVITAKDKVCLSSGKGCNPDDCPYAKGYYDKIQKVLRDAILSYDTFDKKTIIKIAKEYEICPFEFQLDLSLFTDIVICDYNYLFDPQVFLRRHFETSRNQSIVLVDEAHNLVERGRSMYSASVTSKEFDLMKKSVKEYDHRKLKNSIKKLTTFFNTYRKEYGENETVVEDFEPKFYRALDSFLKAGQDLLKTEKKKPGEDFMDFFFSVNKFLKISELFDSTYCAYFLRKGKKYLECNLLCLNPSQKLRGCMDIVKGVVFFSATLTPISYFVDVLGGDEDDPQLILPSPFSKENFLLMIAPKISTRYADRNNTYIEIKEMIEQIIKRKIANYLIFLPSYEYLNNIEPLFAEISDINLITQKKDMSEDEAKSFLEHFEENPTQTTVGLAVIGGIFSEGIDLMSDRLYAAIIVGVGLPQLSFERNVIKDYYASIGLNGYDYSYLNPGMNRVMQAVGRVIRSETDRGLALLIDDRYMLSKYRSLFKNSWSHYKVVIDKNDVSLLLADFQNK